MKYLLAILVVGIIAATATACGGSDDIGRSEEACDKALRDRDHASHRIERFQQDFDRADPASAQSIYAASGVIQHGGLLLGLEDYLLECSNVSSDHKSQLASARHEYVQALQQLQSACRRMMGTVDAAPTFDDRYCTMPVEEIARWRACFEMSKTSTWGGWEPYGAGAEFTAEGFCAGRDTVLGQVLN